MNKLILIPVITDPLGKQWRQPDQSEMLIDDKHAVMYEPAFENLYDYSHSYPTGSYAGKMWKRYQDGRWLLVWIEPAKAANHLVYQYREIIIL